MEKLKGPQTYKLLVKKKTCSVIGPNGENHFINPATEQIPKLYLIYKGSKILYAGVTVQSMSNRLRIGMKATGKGGYHGYPWREKNDTLGLDVWWSKELKPKDMESIEAEVAYLYRKESGQWPSDQSEIHFHKTNHYHRESAKAIVRRVLQLTE